MRALERHINTLELAGEEVLDIRWGITCDQHELSESSGHPGQGEAEEEPPQLYPPQEHIEKIHSCSGQTTPHHCGSIQCGRHI